MKATFFSLFLFISSVCNAQISLNNPGEGYMKISISNNLANRVLQYSDSPEGEQITLPQWPQDFYLSVSNPVFYMFDYGEQTYTRHDLTPESANPNAKTGVKFQWYQERDNEIKLLTNYMQAGIRNDFVSLGHTYDLNFDEEINTEDFNLLMSNFGGVGMGDVNNDTQVDGTDFIILQSQHKPTPLFSSQSAIRAIPEPGNMILGLLGSVLLFVLARIKKNKYSV